MENMEKKKKEKKNYSKNFQIFQKALEIKARGAIATAKSEITTSIKNNHIGINGHKNTRETDFF